MPMTKKHYEALVRVIKESTLDQDRNLLDKGMVLTRLCNMLKADNSKFDEDKFYEAVYKEDKVCSSLN
jgi:hypothetical protein